MMRSGCRTREGAMALLVAVAALAPWASGPRAGECTESTNARSIIAAATAAHPDSLPHEAKYVLGCTAYPLDAIAWRAPRYLPSWQLLRNTRRELRDLGRTRDLVPALVGVSVSHDPMVRRAACTALALYGQTAYCDSLETAAAQLVLLRVFAGCAGADSLGIASYAGSNRKPVILDALYYQSSPAAVGFIAEIAADPADPALQERARWMLEHPMPVEAAWKL